MQRAAVLLGAVASLGWTAIGFAQPEVVDPRFERIAEVATDKMKEYGIPGVALGIFFEDLSQTRGFGVTSVANPLPVTESTLFQIGSITKTFTGTAVMRLVEEGKVRLDSPVRDYLSGFRVRDPEASRRATVETLLTHTGGWEGDLFVDPGSGDDALARLVDRMAELEQVAPFDTIWSYNNAGFYALGRLIEVSTGKSYEAALQELVLDRIGLRETYLFPSEAMTYRFAVGHAGPVDEPFVLRPWAIPRAMNPAGGVVASVEDLLRYGRFHLGESRGPLTSDSLRAMQETRLVQHGSEEEMALAWQVTHLAGLRAIWHDGATLGQQALLLLVPSRRLVVAVLTNSVRGEFFNRDLRRAIAREYLGVSEADPPLIPRTASELTEYAGRYSRPFLDVVVTAEGDRLLIQRIQKQGFPSESSPVPPPFPRASYAFYSRDRLIGLGPARGDRVEFLRNDGGAVGWIRVTGRVARRLPHLPD